MSQGTLQSLSRPMIKGVWRPPSIGFIKLNFDASFHSVLKTSIAAVLARNHEGKILGACTYPSQDIVNAFVAEARACERALLFALEMGFQCLQLEGDSLALEGRRCQLPCFWTEEAPNSVRKMVAEDWRVWNQDR